MSASMAVSCDTPARKGRGWIRGLAIVAIVFGATSIFSGGRVLFGDDAQRSVAGAVVPLVLWFNFLSGLLYIAAGVGLLRFTRWSMWLSTFIAAALVAVGLYFAAHAVSGGAYEIRTAMAMLLRVSLWIAIAIFAHRMLGSRTGNDTVAQHIGNRR